MRLVFDTNIFVSAALKRHSVPWMAIDIATRHGILLKSSATEAQLFEVIARPRLAPAIPYAAVARFNQLFASAELVTITERIVACRDPTDDKFLELAVNGKADMVVSGDADLLVMHPFQGIPIVIAAAFVHGAV